MLPLTCITFIHYRLLFFAFESLRFAITIATNIETLGKTKNSKRKIINEGKWENFAEEKWKRDTKERVFCLSFSSFYLAGFCARFKV